MNRNISRNDFALITNMPFSDETKDRFNAALGVGKVGQHPRTIIRPLVSNRH